MLRRHGFDGAVTIVSNDADAPYDRPNCSKDFLAGEAPARGCRCATTPGMSDSDIDLKLKTEIESLDVGGKSVSLKSGDSLAYDALCPGDWRGAVAAAHSGPRPAQRLRSCAA